MMLEKKSIKVNVLRIEKKRIFHGTSVKFRERHFMHNS